MELQNFKNEVWGQGDGSDALSTYLEKFVKPVNIKNEELV